MKIKIERFKSLSTHIYIEVYTMGLILIKSITEEAEEYLSDDELNEAINEFYEEEAQRKAIDRDRKPLKGIRKSAV